MLGDRLALWAPLLGRLTQLYVQLHQLDGYLGGLFDVLTATATPSELSAELLDSMAVWYPHVLEAEVPPLWESLTQTLVAALSQPQPPSASPPRKRARGAATSTT